MRSFLVRTSETNLAAKGPFPSRSHWTSKTGGKYSARTEKGKIQRRTSSFILGQGIQGHLVFWRKVSENCAVMICNSSMICSRRCLIIQRASVVLPDTQEIRNHRNAVPLQQILASDARSVWQGMSEVTKTERHPTFPGSLASTRRPRRPQRDA